MTVDRNTTVRDARQIGALWAGVLLPPVAFLSNLGLGYVLVPRECASTNSLPIHLTHLAFLLLTLLGGWIGWRGRQEPHHEVPRDPEGSVGRVALMAASALLGSVMFSLVIVAQWIASLMLDPCR
jgi:hypothetical protein